MNQISALASNQLEAWEDIAKNWHLVPMYLENGHHLVCYKDNISVYPITATSVTPSILLASTVAHLRNLHRELDPDA